MIRATRYQLQKQPNKSNVANRQQIQICTELGRKKEMYKIKNTKNK